MIGAAYDLIIEYAKTCPNDGTPICFTGKVYLGSGRDFRNGHPFIDKKTETKETIFNGTVRKTIYAISQMGQEALKEMQTEALKDGIKITRYLFGFGSGPSLDSDYEGMWVGSKKFEYFRGSEFFSTPCETKEGDLTERHVRSSTTNQRFESLPNYYWGPGLYVEFSYKG